MNWKPWMLAKMRTPFSVRRRVVQVVSYPYEEQIADLESGKPVTAAMVKVRMVPTQPWTIDEVWVDNLAPFTKQDGPLPKKIEIAWAVSNGGMRYFPEDMLRYDCCALCDHEQPESGEDGNGWLTNGKPVMIYRVSSYAKWHPDRWFSYGFNLTELKSFRFKDFLGEELVK